MYNNLKKEIEKDFNKEKNYNAIIFRKEEVINMKKIKLRYVLIPICTIFISVIAISKTALFNKELNKDITKKEWRVKEVYVDRNTENTTAIIPKWEQISISEQFNEVKYNNSEYFSKKTKISKDMIEKNIGTSILTGYDIYTKNTYNKNADLYSIKNISQKCAIAVKFEENNDYYVYANLLYRPQTLREFVEDLQLREIVSFGTIYYDYWEENEQGNKEYQNIEFYNVDNKIIWQMLFDDLNLENIYNDNGKYKSDRYNTSVKISVDIPLLGYKNISVELTDKGYLITNILDSGKAFYIGEEKVQKFLNYIKENYDGYKIIYIYENKEEITNEEKEEKIVTYNLLTKEEQIVNDTEIRNITTNTSIENRTEPYVLDGM